MTCAVAGAPPSPTLLGKLKELGAMPANDYTLEGRLIGHVAGILAMLKGLPLTYDRDMQDIFAVRSEVAQQVAATSSDVGDSIETREVVGLEDRRNRRM